MPFFITANLKLPTIKRPQPGSPAISPFYSKPHRPIRLFSHSPSLSTLRRTARLDSCTFKPVSVSQSVAYRSCSSVETHSSPFRSFEKIYENQRARRVACPRSFNLFRRVNSTNVRPLLPSVAVAPEQVNPFLDCKPLFPSNFHVQALITNRPCCHNHGHHERTL